MMDRLWKEFSKNHERRVVEKLKRPQTSIQVEGMFL